MRYLNFLKQFGANLKERREELRLSVSEAATEIGVTAKTYRRWEAGIAGPRVRKLVRIAECFQCSLESLSAEREEDRT